VGKDCGMAEKAMCLKDSLIFESWHFSAFEFTDMT